MTASPLAQHAPATVLRFGECELHLPTHELWRQGQRQPIRRMVFDLIVHLIERRPAVVPHADLALAVWGRRDARPSLLARAVMEARQAIGDVAEEPEHILTVRGVGYRFAAQVSSGPPVSGADAGLQAGIEDMRTMVADAEAAMAAGDNERGQFLCDRALALAEASGINRERARALIVSAMAAMKRGTLDQAARMATQALQLAESEGHAQLAAQARVRIGRVRLAVGDVLGGLRQLESAYVGLQAPEMREEKRRCECLFALAHRELRQYDLALQWCATTLATAREIDPAMGALMERGLEVDVLVAKADALRERGEEAAATGCCVQALSLSEAMRPDLDATGTRDDWLCWMGNHGLALAGLDRVDEAWRIYEEMAQALADWPDRAGPSYLSWKASLHVARADLLSRLRRFDEALEQIGQAMQVSGFAGFRVELPTQMAVAARVCERAGRYQEALGWVRRQHALLADLQMERARSLAQVVHAESEIDTLRRDLETARQSAQQLALENRMLSARLAELERVQVLDETGFTHRAMLPALLSHRHADARERDVPFCLGLLAMHDLPAWSDRHGAPCTAALMRELAQALAALPGTSSQVVHLGAGRFLFWFEQMGERRARALCEQIRHDLNTRAWRALQSDAQGPRPRFDCACLDAAAQPDVEAVMQRLVASLPAAAHDGIAAD